MDRRVCGDVSACTCIRGHAHCMGGHCTSARAPTRPCGHGCPRGLVHVGCTCALTGVCACKYALNTSAACMRVCMCPGAPSVHASACLSASPPCVQPARGCPRGLAGLVPHRRPPGSHPHCEAAASPCTTCPPTGSTRFEGSRPTSMSSADPRGALTHIRACVPGRRACTRGRSQASGPHIQGTELLGEAAQPSPAHGGSLHRLPTPPGPPEPAGVRGTAGGPAEPSPPAPSLGFSLSCFPRLVLPTPDASEATRGVWRLPGARAPPPPSSANGWFDSHELSK